MLLSLEASFRKVALYPAVDALLDKDVTSAPSHSYSGSAESWERIESKETGRIALSAT
jgi:hypothetical protein